jgi:hypothetical protein
LEYTSELLAREANASLNFEEWRGRGRELASKDTNRQFEIGDWILAGEERFQKKAYKEASIIFKGYNRASLRNLASVARQVPTSLRNDNLSWNHHLVVAKFKPEYQKKWLDLASGNGWSSKQLRAFVNEKHPPITKRLPNIHPQFAEQERKVLETLAHSRSTTVNKLVCDLVLEYLRKPKIKAEIRAANSAPGNGHV